MKIDFKKLGESFFVILLIIFVFTLIDFFVHQLSGEYSVPSYYFRNKLIFGTIWAFVVYLFVRKLKPLAKAAIISAVVVVFLQIKYYLEGYPKDFVFLFLGIHFVILLATTLLVFKLFEKKL